MSSENGMPATRVHDIVRLLFRIIVAPIMVALYFGIAFPLLVVYAMDWAFDLLGWYVGWDTRYWPLPKGQDEEFRFRQTKCRKCRRTIVD